MRILFDNGTPRGVASVLTAHAVEEARSRGWDVLRNGELLDAAEAAGFDMLGKGRWGLVKKELAAISAAVDAATPGSFVEIAIPAD